MGSRPPFRDRCDRRAPRFTPFRRIQSVGDDLDPDSLFGPRPGFPVRTHYRSALTTSGCSIGYADTHRRLRRLSEHEQFGVIVFSFPDQLPTEIPAGLHQFLDSGVDALGVTGGLERQERKSISPCLHRAAWYPSDGAAVSGGPDQRSPRCSSGRSDLATYQSHSRHLLVTQSRLFATP